MSTKGVIRFGEMKNIDFAANFLLMLSRGEDHRTQAGRVFECKTCSRQFPSFQALGGHRASHKKPRIAGGEVAAAVAKPRSHECSICGIEFAIGQALGGHMRRHRAAAAAAIRSHEGLMEVKNSNGKRPAASLDLDLNLAPSSESEGECRTMIFGFDLVDKAPLVH